MTSKLIISIFDSIPLGVMISPIILCSIILLAVIIERIIFFKKINIDYRLLMANVMEGIKSKKITEAKGVCLPYSGPLVDLQALHQKEV